MLRWVPGHRQTEDNEEVDMVAREGALSSLKGSETAHRINKAVAKGGAKR